jgi:hypothetical protein
MENDSLFGIAVFFVLCLLTCFGIKYLCKMWRNKFDPGNTQTGAGITADRCPRCGIYAVAYSRCNNCNATVLRV